MAKGIQRILQEDHYHEIFQGFQIWHISSFVKLLNQNNNRGGVLPFVRGLRLSAQIIYAIRDILSETDLEVDWGHILDDEGNFCSRECDIIIHKRGFVRKWNGRNGCVMDFKFINKKKAIAVISCKSFVDSSVIQREKVYCKEMKKFVKKVWMFGECCTPASIDTLTKKAKEVGFNKFWYSYTWNKKNDETQPNHLGWNNFIQEIKKLK